MAECLIEHEIFTAGGKFKGKKIKVQREKLVIKTPKA